MCPAIKSLKCSVLLLSVSVTNTVRKPIMVQSDGTKPGPGRRDLEIVPGPEGLCQVGGLAERSRAHSRRTEFFASMPWTLHLNDTLEEHLFRPSRIALRNGLTIGRGDNVDLQLDSDAFPGLCSRVHARFDINEATGEARLHNFSENESRVGNCDLHNNESLPLVDGCVVGFGTRGWQSNKNFTHVNEFLYTARWSTVEQEWQSFTEEEATAVTAAEAAVESEVESAGEAAAESEAESVAETIAETVSEAESVAETQADPARKGAVGGMAPECVAESESEPADAVNDNVHTPDSLGPKFNGGSWLQPPSTRRRAASPARRRACRTSSPVRRAPLNVVSNGVVKPTPATEQEFRCRFVLFPLAIMIASTSVLILWLRSSSSYGPIVY